MWIVQLTIATQVRPLGPGSFGTVPAQACSWSVPAAYTTR